MRGRIAFVFFCVISSIHCAATMRSTHAADLDGASWRLSRPAVEEGPRNEEAMALEEAWADYEQAVAKASEKLLKLFDTAVGTATRKGDLGAVQALTDAQKAFVEQGTLPTDKSFLSAVAGLKKQVATANAALMRSYAKAVSTLTKKGDVEGAKRLQSEQDSVFAGVAVAGGPRKAAAKPWAVDLTREETLKREWKMEGKYELQVTPQGRDAVGKIKLIPAAAMTTTAKFDGDLAMQLMFETGVCPWQTIFRITAWGHDLDIRQEGKHQLEVRREGAQLIYSIDGKPPTVVRIKDEHQKKPTAVSLRCIGVGEAQSTMSCTLGPIVIQGTVSEEKTSSEQR